MSQENAGLEKKGSKDSLISEILDTLSVEESLQAPSLVGQRTLSAVIERVYKGNIDGAKQLLLQYSKTKTGITPKIQEDVINEIVAFAENPKHKDMVEQFFPKAGGVKKTEPQNTTQIPVNSDNTTSQAPDPVQELSPSVVDPATPVIVASSPVTPSLDNKKSYIKSHKQRDALLKLQFNKTEIDSLTDEQANRLIAEGKTKYEIEDEEEAKERRDVTNLRIRFNTEAGKPGFSLYKKRELTGPDGTYVILDLYNNENGKLTLKLLNEQTMKVEDVVYEDYDYKPEEEKVIIRLKNGLALEGKLSKSDEIKADNENEEIVTPDDIIKAKSKEKKDKQKNKDREEFLNNIRIGDRFVIKGEEAEALNILTDNDTVELKTRFGTATHTKEELRKLVQEGRFKTEKEAYLEKKQVLAEMARYIKEHRLDQIVIHSEPYIYRDAQGKNEQVLKWTQLDFDTQGAMKFLNYNESGELPKNIFNENANIELVNKGESSSLVDPNTGERLKPGSVVLHVDVGERTLSIEKDGDIILLFADHHAPQDSIKTSGTEMVFQLLTEAGVYNIEPWMRNVVKFTNSIDNLSYANHPNFNSGFLQKKWPKTLHALFSVLPFEVVFNYAKEGRDPYKPFTEEEIETLRFTIKREGKDPEALAKDPKSKKMKMLDVEISLKDLIQEKYKEMENDLYRTRFAYNRMLEQGIKTETPELKKVLFNTLDPQTSYRGKKEKNFIKNKYLTARAMGNDTYIDFDEKNGKWMINSSTVDLAPLAERLREYVPNLIFVRGVMMFAPKNKGDRGNLTREQFLQICGLVDEHTKLNLVSKLSKKEAEAKLAIEEDVEQEEKKEPKSQKKSEVITTSTETKEDKLTPEQADIILENYIKKLEQTHNKKLSSYSSPEKATEILKEVLKDFPIENIRFEDGIETKEEILSPEEESDLLKDIVNNQEEQQKREEEYQKVFTFEREKEGWKVIKIDKAKEKRAIEKALTDAGLKKYVSIKEATFKDNKSTTVVEGYEIGLKDGKKIPWGSGPDIFKVTRKEKFELSGRITELIKTIINTVSDEEAKQIALDHRAKKDNAAIQTMVSI